MERGPGEQDHQGRPQTSGLKGKEASAIRKGRSQTSQKFFAAFFQKSRPSFPFLVLRSPPISTFSMSRGWDIPQQVQQLVGEPLAQGVIELTAEFTAQPRVQRLVLLRPGAWVS